MALRVLVSQCSEDVLLAIRDARILRTRALRRTLVNRRCTLGSKWQPAPNVEPLLNDAYEQAQDPPQCVQYEGMKNWYLIFLMSPDWMTSLAFFFFFFSWSAAIEPTFPIRGRSEKDFYFIFNFVGKTYLNTEKCLGVICHKRLNTQAFMNVHVDELDGGLTSVALTKTNSCQKKRKKKASLRKVTECQLFSLFAHIFFLSSKDCDSVPTHQILTANSFTGSLTFYPLANWSIQGQIFKTIPNGLGFVSSTLFFFLSRNNVCPFVLKKAKSLFSHNLKIHALALWALRVPK